MRQHGAREEKNEFEKLVSVATSLQDSKPAQVLTLEWRRPRVDGHRVAGTDIMSVGEPDSDSRIASFWKRFPNVLKWYQYADSLLGNLSGWEARINRAILRMASDEKRHRDMSLRCRARCLLITQCLPSTHGLWYCKYLRWRDLVSLDPSDK